MAEYSCNSRECDGRVFEAQSNTGRCIHCGSEDIERLDRPWLVPTIVVSGLIIAIGALGWWRVALDEQGRESLRNFQLSGCKDMTACNFTPAALMDDAASCTYDDDLRDCDGTCKEDADGDGVCDSQEILGCIDEAACNFNKNATEEELICEYPEPGFTCAGDCVNDKDGDGICDENEVLGCTDPAACNFDADATEPDGSCWYREVGKSCEESASPYSTISCDINNDDMADVVRYRLFPDEHLGINQWVLEIDTSQNYQFLRADYRLDLTTEIGNWGAIYGPCDQFYGPNHSSLEAFCQSDYDVRKQGLLIADPVDRFMNLILESGFNRVSSINSYRLELLDSSVYITSVSSYWAKLGNKSFGASYEVRDYQKGICSSFDKMLEENEEDIVIRSDEWKCELKPIICNDSFVFTAEGFGDGLWAKEDYFDE